MTTYAHYYNGRQGPQRHGVNDRSIIILGGAMTTLHGRQGQGWQAIVSNLLRAITHLAPLRICVGASRRGGWCQG